MRTFEITEGSETDWTERPVRHTDIFRRVGILAKSAL